MKYKVGDKVRVRKDLEVGIDYGKRAVVPEMTNLAGMISTIKSVGRDCYELEEDIDLFDWTDEMIEGLWEECKSSEQVSKSEGKLKLIDILNKIANGKLKEGTKVVRGEEIYIWDNKDCFFYNEKDNFICLDPMKCLNDEVELIEPQEPTECEHEWENYVMYNPNIGESRDFRKCAKCDLEEDIEPTDNTKIEELDKEEMLCLTLQCAIAVLTDKLNEVIRKLNKED